VPHNNIARPYLTYEAHTIDTNYNHSNKKARQVSYSVTYSHIQLG